VTRRARLAEIDLPEFGEPTVEPEIPRAVYEARVAAAAARMRDEGLGALVVYADREHSANLAYLTGYDPRFEEALLVLVEGRRPTLVVGNEGWGYADLAGGTFDKVLWQPLSLMGQPRDKLRPLADILREAGLRRSGRVGAVGWKYFAAVDGGGPDWIDFPSFVAELIKGVSGAIVNATHIFMNPRDGLRAVSDVHQLARFEFAATFASQGLRNVLFGLRPGMTELEAARLMQLNGLPLSAHPMLSAGPRARAGLPSPSLRRIERGEPITMALGLWGGLSARAGFMVEDASELPLGIRDYVETLVAPYFEAVVAWYETLAIGVPAGALYEAIHSRIGDKFFGVSLNPGHLIHLDEWVHSPVTKESDIPLVSGMALQADVIPATGTDYFTTNIEDGIALADSDLRAAFARLYPEAWARIEKRRAFMIDALGIRLEPEVLPFSNIPAYLPPFWLAPRSAMTVR
jgi:hypothetical protein